MFQGADTDMNDADAHRAPIRPPVTTEAEPGQSTEQVVR
jgi:hypothetical protein